MLEAGDVKEGDRVLDVACGTGVVAREAVSWVGDAGQVVGLDTDEAMLSVAKRSEPGVVWKIGNATALPFDDESFDVVICQAGLMFFPDRAKAVSEMRRVLRSDGRAVVHVWAQCEAQDEFADLLEHHVGRKAADNYRAPWNLQNPAKLIGLIKDGGFSDARLSTQQETAVYPSLELFLEGASGILFDAESNTDRLRQDTAIALNRYIGPDGVLSFPEPAHIVIATKT